MNCATSLQYAIQQNLAPVISMSYGGCEQRITSGSLNTTFWRTLGQQANAEGITWVASSGDSGAAGCDISSSPFALFGAAVLVPASLPEVTAVGGTEFNEGNGQYWNSSNDSKGGSAVGYIPEVTWNDSALRGDISGSGGGASLFFSKPARQVFQGVPNDSARDVPDVAFAASGDHDGYLIGSNGNLVPIGGTSAATPVFAGIVALLNQSLAQANPGLGNT